MGLAGALEAMSDEALGHLLRARPDLLHPPPTDFGQLASRAGAWRSVLACLDRLDRFTLQVIDVLCLLPEPASAENVLTLLGPPAEGDDVVRALDRLRSRGLVVIGEGAVRLTGTTRSQHPHPAHLGRPLATLLAGPHGARPGDICR
ncbi:MAG: DNA-binding protein, partial [Actinomycetota bacterium]|nr:DNA-binding protein [Actinomycetota bacterium]